MFKKDIEKRISEFTDAWFKIADINKNGPAGLASIGENINEKYFLELVCDKRWAISDRSGDKTVCIGMVKADKYAFPKLLAKYLKLYFV